MPSPIPPRPEMRQLDPKSKTYEQDQFENNRIMANYNLGVQQAFAQLNQENEMKSNLEKKKDEALRAIIGNIGR